MTYRSHASATEGLTRPTGGTLGGAALRLASARGATILCFHQVAPERFARWIEVFNRHLRLVGLDELVDRHERGESLARLLAITLDDGWASTCGPVAEICERRQWPATIYAISSVVASGGSLWFAELPALLRQATGGRAELDGHVLDLTSPAAKERTTATVMDWLRALPGTDALDAVRELRARLGCAPVEPSEPPFIDDAFVRRHANSPWISFEAHTVDHQCLAVQDESAQRRQMLECNDVLQSLTGRPVSHFCYPYGDPSAIGAFAPRVVRSIYRSATTMTRGVCTPRDEASLLPRIPLYESDGDARAFAKVALASLI